MHRIPLELCSYGAWARAILRWVTSMEVLVLHPSLYLFNRLILFSLSTPSLLRSFAGFNHRHGVSGAPWTRREAGKVCWRDELCGGQVGTGKRAGVK